MKTKVQFLLMQIGIQLINTTLLILSFHSKNKHEQRSEEGFYLQIKNKTYY